MKKFLGLLTMVFVLSLGTMYGQGDIDAQRPTLTESNTLINKGLLQFENGLQHNFINETLEMNTFARYCVTDFIELRTVLNYESPDYTLGAKFQLFDAENALNLGLSAVYMYYHNSNNDYRLAFTKNFKNCNFAMNYNLGYDVGVYHILLAGYSMQKFYIFAEYNTQRLDLGGTEINYDRIHGGVTYKVIESVQLDLNGGYYLDSENYYGGVGLSFYVK